MRIVLKAVNYMPRELEPGVLYVAEEFGTAAHLCACGCGAKIRTPLGPTEWTLRQTSKGPSLYPSIGNWQQDCQSHYWIHQGRILWAKKWSHERILAGRQEEEESRQAYYDGLERRQPGLLKRIWRWLTALYRR